MPTVQFGGFIPDEYALALGHAVAQWNFLEAELDTYHRFLRAHPSVSTKKIPFQFQAASDRFLEAAKVAFAATPSLTDKLRAVIDAAKSLCEQRNRLLHSLWFWHGAQTPPILLLKYEPDGTRSAYSASLQEIKSFTEDVRNCHGSLLDIFVQWGFLEVTPLEPYERSALQEFRNKYLLTFPDPTATPVQPPPQSFRA